MALERVDKPSWLHRFCRVLRFYPAMNSRPLTIALLVAATLFAGRARAHETDQFSVPVGQEFVDLGDLWNRLLHEAVRRSVEQTNKEIAGALKNPVPELGRMRVASLQSPDHIAQKVRWQFPVGLLMIEEIEATFEREQQKPKHAGKLVMYRPEGERATYNRLPWLPDPRILTRTVVARSSTIKVHGSHFGTDKFGHFLGWGHLYYLQYRMSRGLGNSQEESLRAAITTGNKNPVGEMGLHGLVTTGVYSNADLAANLVGAKFYINLTESVSLQGELCPPMLERDGEFWRLAPHVQPQGRFFSLFVSDHFDEALNPCVYEPVMRGSVRSFVRDHSQELVDWYAGSDQQQRTPEWFDEQWRSLATYYGEDYGHWGDESNLVLMSQLCFDRPPAPAAETTTVKATKRGSPARGAALKLAPQHAAATFAPVVTPFRDVRLSVRSEGPDVSLLGATADYAIAVANDGRGEATDVYVRLQIPRGLVVTTLQSPAEFDPQQQTLVWHLAQLQPGQEEQLRFKARTTAPGHQVQRIEVFSGDSLVAQDVRPLEVLTQMARQPQRGPVTVAVSDEEAAE